jgi:hypothetical protein
LAEFSRAFDRDRRDGALFIWALMYSAADPPRFAGALAARGD